MGIALSLLPKSTCQWPARLLVPGVGDENPKTGETRQPAQVQVMTKDANIATPKRIGKEVTHHYFSGISCSIFLGLRTTYALVV